MVAAPAAAGPKEKVWVAKGQAPKFHEDRTVDQLMAMVVALTAEISILRERLDTHERLASVRGVFSPADVEDYVPGPEVMQDRGAQRTRLMRKVFRVMKEDLARYDTQTENVAYDKVFKEINDG